MRPGPFRSTERHPLTERRLREIGDWGEAGRHIGARWEDLGLARTRDWIGSKRTTAYLIPLAADWDLQETIRGLGLTNPDALLAEPAATGLAIRPLDLKWTLEVASYEQISAPALRELLAAAGDELGGGDPCRGRIQLEPRDT